MKRHIYPSFLLFLLLELLMFGCGSDTTIINNNNNNTVPDPPVLVSPANGSIDSAMLGVFLWNSSNGATSYKIQISSDTSFTSILADETITSTSYTYSGTLQLASIYYWRVKGLNSNGEGNYSARWSFRTPAVIGSSIAGDWTLIYNGGTLLDICPGERVIFPNNSSGTATLQCPGQNSIQRSYTRNGNVLTYNSSGTQYTISFTTNNQLVLTGINNNRILYYANTVSDNIVNSKTIIDLNLINSSN